MHQPHQPPLREQILRLGQQGRPRDFLPRVAQYLRELTRSGTTDDASLFLAAAALAKLGLRTLALEQLEHLPDAARDHPDVGALRSAIERLPGDRRPHAPDLFEANLAAALRQGLVTTSDADHLRQTPSQLDVFAASDGGIVWRPATPAGSPPPLHTARGLFEVDAIARQIAATLREQTADHATRPPVMLEGLCPPIIDAIRSATPTGPDGRRTRLTVLDHDPRALAAALATHDLRPMLADDRVEFFLGTDAAARLTESLRNRRDGLTEGPVIRLPDRVLSHHDEPLPDPGAIVRTVLDERRTAEDRDRDAIAATYRDRDASLWAARFDAALAGAGEPLRVLIPTCRYSTYIQHASRDLAGAFTRAGHRAEVLIEQDDTSVLTHAGYRRALRELEPDLVVLINYPRAAIGPGVVPPNVPFVCWVQDPMPHLFDDALGRAHTDLDFVCGLTFAPLFTEHGYPIDNALPVPVVADATKFHDGPITDADRERFACDLAFVTHHAETPQAMFDRLRRDSGAAADADRVIAGVWEALPAIAARAHRDDHRRAITSLVTGLAREHLAEPDRDRIASMVERHIALPLFDRLFRHQALAWAGELCDERGWTLRIFGNGWESHPTLARFAGGPLDHAEPLRAAYQAATVHLQVNATTMAHQRVFECALSGGIPACRLYRAAIEDLRRRALARAINDQQAHEPGTLGTRQTRVYSEAGSPEAMRYTALRQRLGLIDPHDPRGGAFADAGLFITDQRAERLARTAPLSAIEQDATWILGDLAETTFWDKQSLARMVERAAEPRWRQSTSRGLRARLSDRLTHDALARRLLSFVRRRLGSTAAARKRAAA